MRQQGGMKASTAWSPAAGLNVVSVERGDQAWTVTVDGRLPPACPRCGALSNSRHSTYSRTLRDLSAQGAPVIVRARLGRWRCRDLKCGQRIFAERLPGLAAPLSRQTTRLAEIVHLLGHSAGGRPSERLMRRLGMPISDTTILASLKQYAKASSENCAGVVVRVAGVDDWAWRKSSHYGTIIVDLERHEVVDVLADRSAATTACWFRQHPSVEVVSRDRAGLYAEAAREGAPQARQVADRFHLLQNFRETVERQLGRYEAPVPEARVSPDDSHVTAAAPSDCGSDVAEQMRLMHRGAWLPGNNSSTRSEPCLKGAIPSGRSPANWALAADASKDGFVASTCRIATQWRQRLPTLPISACCWSADGRKASPRFVTC